MHKDKEIKTNAMRLLDKLKLKYSIYTYENDGTCIDGESVALLLKQDPSHVFKTLVLKDLSNYYVFVLPVNHELDLKKCARCLNIKSLEMLPTKDLLPISGYVRGGCSPLGMKKAFKTIIHESCLEYDTIIFSGGKIGKQIEMEVKDLLLLPLFSTNDIIKN